MSIKSRKGGAQAPLLGSRIQLKVEKLAIGGAGVARHEGMVVFIPLAAPQEEILAEITLVKKNFMEAKIVEILQPSPFRREPPCPVATICGGCNWQQITEEEQRRQKESLVLETLKKFNPTLEFTYLPLQPSPRAFRYRNRIQPKYHKGSFGFFAKNSHQVVDIKDCPITEEKITSHFPEVREWVKKKSTGAEVQRLEMYLSSDEKIHYGLITDEDEGVGFSQVNRFQNEDLKRTVLQWAGADSYKTIYDLYAGSGNFTFPLAESFPQTPVIGVELSSRLVTRAQNQIQDPRIQYFMSDVESYLMRASLKPQDLVLLDPPRAGCSQKIMEILAKSQVKKIIYISCHPVSLARDLKWFFEACQVAGVRYSLSQVQAFEMFPQTDHVETIAELRVDS